MDALTLGTTTSVPLQTLDKRKLSHKTSKIGAKYWGMEALSAYFPEEIIREILLRLPIKFVIKCSAVCKLWNSLIRSPSFIHTHHMIQIQSNNQNDEGVHLLLLRAFSENTKIAPYSLRWDNPAFGEYTKLICPIYNNRSMEHRVVGTCNGLVCLSAYSDEDGYFIVIWNPSIRKYVILPNSPTLTKTSSVRYAFCYDSCINDYMVLRIVSKGSIFWQSNPCEAVEVWSLARGSWKSVSAAAIPADFLPYGNKHAFVNGALHWARCCETDDEDHVLVSIVTFDMVNESFGEVPVCEAVRGMSSPYVFRYGEFLALFDYFEPATVDMWVMTEYGVAESWSKLFSLCVQESDIEPFGFRKSGEVVIQVDGGILKSVDPKSQEVKDFGIDGYEYYFFMDSFVESLVLLDQANAISY